MKKLINQSFKKKFIRLFFLLVSAYFYSQSYLPVSSGEIINHKYYTLSYNEFHEQAEWLHYKLSFPMINGSTKRTNNFKKDLMVKTGSASPSDYYKSGFDRGHLAPAADMKLNKIMMSESFLMTNISPQNGSFNKGGWKKLEELVRSWGSYKTLYITTAGVLNDKNLMKIGDNNVSIPARFYKIIFDPKQKKVISFLMPNKKITNELINYTVTVDFIEDITGIDFLAELDDNIEERIESNVDVTNWNFNQTRVNKNYKKYSNYDTKAKEEIKPKSNVLVRCIAITQKGNQCKRNASSGDKYCWQHKK